MLSYMLNLKERNYAVTTVARKVAAAKSFFGFMVSEGKLREDPTENISSPKVGKPLPDALSISQVRKLIEQPAKTTTPDAKRDRAMLELLYASWYAGQRIDFTEPGRCGHKQLFCALLREGQQGKDGSHLSAGCKNSR